MRIPLFHVDAFAEQPFQGNPAAICLLDSWLDDDRLRKVAAENNLSATAFVVSGKSGYELRWFTPLCEVRLCGHATLAAAHILLNQQHVPHDFVQFATRFAGTLFVRKETEHLVMDFPALTTKKLPNSPSGLAEALRLPAPPVESLEATDAYIVVLGTGDSVRQINPDFALLENLHPFVVAATARGSDADFVSRYFAPSYGVPEDPVTGSLHCALAPYWAQRLGRTNLHARQLSQRGGELWCEVRQDRVLLKGKAVLLMEGSISV